MRNPSVVNTALAAHLMFTISSIIQGSFAASSTSVQNGDTLLSIADSAGIPLEYLEAANPGAIATGLYVGQVINVPSNNEPAAATIA